MAGPREWTRPWPHRDATDAGCHDGDYRGDGKGLREDDELYCTSKYWLYDILLNGSHRQELVFGTKN